MGGLGDIHLLLQGHVCGSLEWPNDQQHVHGTFRLSGMNAYDYMKLNQATKKKDCTCGADGTRMVCTPRTS